jgi:7-carboxy-7-deazaguanine synthase
MIRYNETKKASEVALINIFESINGEAYNAGKPTVFIRTFGCNLRCTYCDTSECWTKENMSKIYSERSTDNLFLWKTAKEIFEQVDSIEKNYSQKSICLTGGEPLLEENKDFMIKELLPLFVEAKYDIGIETDGGIDYTDYKKTFGDSKIINANGDRQGVTIIADYKLPYSKMTKLMIKDNFKLYSETDVVKMVISDNEDDWKELDWVVNESGTKASLYISPCFGQVTMHKLPEYVIAHADKRIRCQLQEHKFFWSPMKKDV